MCSRIISPTYNLRKILDPVDLILFNPSWNYDLVSFPVFAEHHQGNCFSCSHLLVGLIVMTDPYHLFIRNTKIDTSDCALTATLQFSQPLV